ncbi:nucleoside/nucleotide kinase family protein [Luteimicrobium sp. NPDC057192]|uniref:nucleoside/nucleotide kinase family protein n=1 Tax=Luteimicrobium sp. NPDC057192 TaxID=3346042 RepID=UPI00363FDB8F
MPSTSQPPAGRAHREPLPSGLFVGLTTLDVVHRVSAPPDPNTKVTARRQDVAAGGPAANAAVVFAALGGRATLVTALGAGAAASAARDDLESHGVRVVDVGPRGFALAVSAVAVDERTGERTVVSPDGGRVEVAPPGHVHELVRGQDVVLLDGHHPSLQAVAARAARAAGVPVLLDAGRWKPHLADLVPWCDVVAASGDFRLGPEPDARAEAVGPGLRAVGVPRVAVTHGGDPVEWWDGDRSGTVPVPRVDVVDTLGAGDAFHGALAWALASGTPFAGAIAEAARVASLRVTVAGPRAWLTLLGAPPVPTAPPGTDALSAEPPTVASRDELVARARALVELARSDGRRRVLGIAGPPGSGKSTLAAQVADALGDAAVVVGQDGYHLAQRELERLGRADRKGAPDTFDAAGFVALLERLVGQGPGDPVVVAPEFRREIEEAVAGAVPVHADTALVVTEGNYLLLDEGPWARVRPLLDEAWFLDPDDAARVEGLVARHVRHGRSEADARAWVERSDEANARLVRPGAQRADVVVRLADW